MLTKNEILEIINQKIQADEKLGDQSGGSGHLSYRSYSIDDFTANEISSELLKIKYRYKIFIETEFTYYPDNPPQEYNYEKVITVNNKKEIVSENKTTEYSTGISNIPYEEWESVKIKIEEYLEKLLIKIEWKYGDCRAPFVYPPTFKIVKLDNDSVEYRCIIKYDLGENELMIFKSEDASNLLPQVIEKLAGMFPL